MSIDKLTTVLPPPANPVENRGDWAAVEKGLGTPLPRDYKDYIATYGTGSINDFISPCNPFSSNKNLSLQREIREQLEGLRGTREKFPDLWPIPLFPEEGGFLPWGKTDNGDVLHWVTEGAPDEWTVAVTAARDPEFEVHPFDMTEFLAKILTREIVCAVFPAKFPKGDPVFEPLG
jgi:hypothetical protein